MEVEQLPGILEETVYLDPFSSAFRPGYGSENALVDRRRTIDRERAIWLMLLDLSGTLGIINYGILRKSQFNLGEQGTVLQCFCPFLVLGDYCFSY